MKTAITANKIQQCEESERLQTQIYHTNVSVLTFLYRSNWRRVSFKDRALYWAAMEVFTRSMVQIQSNDAAVDVKARQMNEAFEKLGVNLTGVKISSVILLARCWSMNGLMSFKDGLKSRKLVVLLTDILITDELKDLVKGTGITLRISADVDPIHLERAEKYFEDTAIETELFKYDKMDVVHRSSPTLMSVNYLNLFTMAYQPNRKLNSLRKSVRLIQIARKESFKTKEVIRSLEVRVREKDRVINEKQKRLTALVEEHCDLPPQKSLGASGIEKDTLNSEVRELHELLTDETSQIVAMNETVREKDAVIDSLTSELQIEKLKFPVVSVRLRLEVGFLLAIPPETDISDTLYPTEIKYIDAG
uniref:Uncharacterized protein LOC102809883 n=1 Tax=Saccoglossus kowalevskii TaxID=10224 RepID=A0ABM0LTR4_SACKO|nr:PREDICTED: uncharacterized protein LOC102809883 [Saccoglossus kowalevskii]